MAVKTGEPQESTKFLHGRKDWPLCHGGNFGRVKFNAVTGDDMTQIFQVTFPEETFEPLEEELMTKESIQHLF